MISFEKPPSGFGTGEQYTNCLRVYFLQQRYYLYDSRGFLCSLRAKDADILEMIALESERPGSVQDHPLRPVGLRAYLDPEWALEREAYHLSLNEATASAAKQIKRERPEAKQVTKLSLEDLGL